MLPTNRTMAQMMTTTPFQKIGASARIPVIVASSRARRGVRSGSGRRARRGAARRGRGRGGRLRWGDADVLRRRDLLDRQDVVHEIVDLLIVHGAGEPNAPRRHVGAGPALSDRGDDVIQALDLGVAERRSTAHRLQVRHDDDAAVEDVLAAVQAGAMTPLAVEPELVLLGAGLGG